MKYTKFYKKFSKVLCGAFYFLNISFVYAADDADSLNNNLITPAIPSMNNGIPYIPMVAPEESPYGPVVDNGKNLQVNGKKVPISGLQDLKEIKGYQPLLKKQEDEIKKFCLNLQDPIQQNYFAVQTKKLQALKKELDQRIALLDKKKKEYETWLTKRNEFLNKAKASLINILSKMDPEEAALKLDKIDDLSAASLLLKLKPRIASAIMNNLSPEKAAYLSEIIIDAQRVPTKVPVAPSHDDATDLPKPVN